MEARLVGCLLLIFLVAYGKSEVNITISKIQKTTTEFTGARADVDNTLICCDNIPDLATNNTLTYKKNENNVETTYIPLGILNDNKKCLQFNESLSSKFTGSGTFIIKFETSAPGTSLGLAQATLNVPDIKDVQTELVGKDKKDLRVSGLTPPPDTWDVTASSDSNTPVPCTCSEDGNVCYALNLSPTPSDKFTACATVNNTFVGQEYAVQVCSEEKAAKLVDTSSEISGMKLLYGDKTIQIQLSSPAATLYDVVASYNNTTQVAPSQNDISSLNVTFKSYDKSERDIYVLVVGYNDATVDISDSASFTDYNLMVNAFGSTLELEWKNSKTLNKFLAKLIAGNSISFNETEVDCNNLDNCYAYFINVAVSDKNIVQIQPNTSSDLNDLNVIVSEDVKGVGPPPSLDNSRDLRIQDVNLEWSSDSLTVGVEVCFHHEDARDLTQYQLLLVDSQGRWLRVHGTSQKLDGILCFSGATLDTRQFRTADQVAVLVTKRDVDGRTVLASGESHVFFITPKVVEGVSGRASFVSWGNPGSYTFTAKMEGRPAQISAADGDFLYYFHRSTTGPNDMLVVEAVTPDVKMSAVVSLSHQLTAAEIPNVRVNEIVVTKSGGTFDVCYQQAPSDKVTYAEITVIEITSDPAKQTDIKAITVDQCPTFETLDLVVESHVLFELRLYSGNEGNYTQIGKGSLDFLMPDLSTLPECSSSYKVGDGKMLRLSCDRSILPGDKISTDDGQTTLAVLASSEFFTKTQYLLLEDEISGKSLKVYREIDGVTVNDDTSTTTVTVTRGTAVINDATQTKPELTSVTLDHVTLTTTVTATSKVNSDKFELVNYWIKDETAGTSTVTVCVDLVSPMSCKAEGYTPGSNSVNVLLVGYAAAAPDTMLESDVHTLQDYDITGRFISSTIIEWHWTIKSADPEYNMIIQLDGTNQDPLPTFTTSTVTCDATDTFCYGYFLGLTNTYQYTVMIQPKTSGGYDALNQIVSGTVSWPRTIVTNDSVFMEQQKGNADRISQRKPGDYAFTIRKNDSVLPLVTSFTCDNCSDNFTTKALRMDFGQRLPRETQDSAVKVTGTTHIDVFSNDVPAVTIKYMTFPIILNPGGSEVKVLVDLETAQDVAAVNSLTLAYINSIDGTHQYIDTIDAKVMTKSTSVVEFDHMKDKALLPGEVTVVVAGHNDAPVAYGLAQITLRDPAAVAYRVGKVGGSDHEAFRITYSSSGDDSGGVQLDYSSSCECQSSPCYCLGSARVAQEPQPFCLQLSNTAAATTKEFVLQCDDKLTATNADEEAPVTSVKMTHKKGTESVDVQVDVSYENTAELTFYKEGTTSVNTPTGTCPSTSPGWCILRDQAISSDTINFNILLVTTGKNDVVQKSKLLSFEDYKTKVTQLTSDAMEVRFSAKVKALYRVTVTPDGGAFNWTSVECGAEDINKCYVYFLSMRIGTEYEATVQQVEGGDLNKVAVQFTMENRKKSSRDATLELRDKENERLLTVCVDGQLPTPSDDYILVLINGLNNTIIEKGPLSKENRCFSEVSLDLQLSQQVKMMVLTDGEDTKVALETDVIILDPTSAISVTQVGSKALKATWSNRNPLDLEYEVGLTGAEDKVECKAQQECIEYIHLHSSTGATNVTIKENNDGTVQVVSVQVSPVTIPELTIISSSIQWDDRLRVCFNRTATADTYELGLEKDAVHLQTSVRAQVDTHATLETCIVSTDTVDVGAYVDLWMVVTAFDSSGVIVASGESTWNTILLSSSRNVRAAIMGTSIFTSWYLLDDPSTIDNFQVILRSSDSDSVFNVSNAKSTYTLTDQISGTYTVCVKALKLKQVPAGSTIASDEVCSDIIVLSSNNETIPDVEETNPKSTAKDAVLLTWQPPQNVENVSGYFVSWTSATSSAKRSPRRLPPQSLVRSHEELRQGVTGDGESDFVIVPATDTSVEVTHLQEGTQYTFCISSIVHDVVDQIPNCKDTNLGDFTPLYTPSLSSTSDGDLEWTDNNTGPVSFLVEWRSPSEEGHQEVNETSYHLQVTPGEWVVSVRTLNADSSSAPNTTTVPVKGVITTVTQEGSRKMVVTWSEEPTPAENRTYTVYIHQDKDQLAEYTLDCYGDVSKSDCYYEFFLENELQRAVQLTVSVSIAYSQVFYNRTFTMEPISGVRSLAQTIRSSNEVVVEWQEVENAKYYQLSLYEDDSLSNRRWMKQQALPLRVTLQEDDMIGNVVVVQACTDDLHCGDATKITIQTQVPSSNSSVVGAVLGGVLGVTILACVIFFFVKRQQLKKKERRQLNCIESEQEMATKQYVYDEWGARRLGQPAVNTTPDNIS